jgi:hypothetical protein
MEQEMQNGDGVVHAAALRAQADADRAKLELKRFEADEASVKWKKNEDPKGKMLMYATSRLYGSKIRCNSMERENMAERMQLCGMKKWSGFAKVRVRGDEFKDALQRELDSQPDIPDDLRKAMLSTTEGLLLEEKQLTDCHVKEGKGNLYKMVYYMRRWKDKEGEYNRSRNKRHVEQEGEEDEGEEMVDFALTVFGASFELAKVIRFENKLIQGIAGNIPQFDSMSTDDVVSAMDLLEDVSARGTVESYTPTERAYAIEELQKVDRILAFDRQDMQPPELRWKTKVPHRLTWKIACLFFW